MILNGTVKNKMFASVAIISAFLKIDSSFAKIDFEGFVALDNTPQEAFGLINIDALWTTSSNITNKVWPVWTIESHACNDTRGLIVSSLPSNIVKAVVNEGALKFEFHDVLFSEGDPAGVRIQVPCDQIEAVTVGDRQTVQILRGSRSLKFIRASTFSTLYATLDTTLNNTLLTRASYNSDIVLETDYTVVDVSGGSTVSVKGSVTGGELEKASTLYVEGPIIKLDVAGGSSAFVNHDSGCDSVEVHIPDDDSCSSSSTLVNVLILDATQSRPSIPSFAHTNNHNLMAVSIIGIVLGFLLF